MESILEKFGIYDIVAVLTTGIGICTFSTLVIQLIYKKDLNLNINLIISETIVFFVISYLVGLFFQEAGSIIQNKIVYKDDGLLKKVLETSDETHEMLTQKEKEGIYNFVKSKPGMRDSDDKGIYNYCKFYVISRCDTTRIDKDQSLSAMSRSLSLYFALLALIVLISMRFYCFDWKKVCLLFISCVTAVILFFRYKRFAKLRYSNIYKIFYYKEVL